MHFSTAVVLAVAAASVAPSFAAPVAQSTLARDDIAGQLIARQRPSRLGRVADGVSIASGVSGIFSDIFNTFKGGNQPQQRDLEELLTVLQSRDLGELEARAGRLGRVADGVSIASGVSGIFSDIFNAFRGGNQPQQRDLEEFLDALQRRDFGELEARAGRLGRVADGISIASGVSGIFSDIFNALRGGSQPQQRDLEEEFLGVLQRRDYTELEARARRPAGLPSRLTQATDTIGIASDLSSIAADAASIFGGGSQPQRRDFDELMGMLERRDFGELEARAGRLGRVADGVSIASGLSGIFSDIFSTFKGGNQPQQRDLEELLTALQSRDLGELEARAGRLGRVADGVSIASGVSGIFSDIFNALRGGNQPQQRSLGEELEMLARRSLNELD